MGFSPGSTRMAEMPDSVQGVPRAERPRNPISRRQVDSVFSRTVALLVIFLCLRALPRLLGQLDEAYPIWLCITLPALFGSFIVALGTSIIGRWVRPAHALVSILYLLALATWPFNIISVHDVYPGIHWLYYLLTAATATAVIGFSVVAGTIYLLVVPLVYLVIRISPAGGGAALDIAILEAGYAIIISGTIMFIVTMLRQAASSVDSAQATAIARYRHAVWQQATETERVKFESIVHDSVLATLIAAARARTPEARALAATMAGNAIDHLRDAALISPDDGTRVQLSTLAERISAAAAGMTAPFELRLKPIGGGCIPAEAAEAIFSAAVQAMVNSLQHAGTAEGLVRWVTIHGVAPRGIEVEVGDTGEGFVLAEVPGGRLGVRVSIIERVANVGGLAGIDSSVGEGTIISIRWPQAEVTP